MRKVAWKASSASWASPSTRRQTPQTIAPWRSTKAAKAISAAVAASADSARLAVYRSRSSLSVSPVAVPAANRARNCRNAEPGCPFPMVVRLAVMFDAARHYYAGSDALGPDSFRNTTESLSDDRPPGSNLAATNRRPEACRLGSVRTSSVFQSR